MTLSMLRGVIAAVATPGTAELLGDLAYERPLPPLAPDEKSALLREFHALGAGQ